MIFILQTNCDGFWAWPWPLILAFLLGLLLGWLLFGRRKNSTCNDCSGLQAELDACRSNSKMLSDKNATFLASSNKTTNVASSLTAAKKETKTVAKTEKPTVKTTKKETKVVVAKTDSGKTAKDDLTKVEGIGPKIQEHFNNGDIFTWEQLSKTAVSRLQEILDAAGPRYRIHNPGSWPKQAAMCAKGEWDKLEKWQDEHKGGRE